MQRNRGRFNQQSNRTPRLGEGNTLTFEQRRLVEKQQEMLRNTPMNQGAPLMQSLGNVAPTSGMLPSLFGTNNLPSLMATPAQPPSMVPSSYDQNQSTYRSGSHSNSSYDNYQSGGQYRDYKQNNRRGGGGGNNKYWNQSNQNTRNYSSGGSSGYNQNQNSSFKQTNNMGNWGKRPRNSQESSWADDNNAGEYQEERPYKKPKLSANYQNEGGNDAWYNESNVSGNMGNENYYTNSKDKDEGWDNNYDSQEGSYNMDNNSASGKNNQSDKYGKGSGQTNADNASKKNYWKNKKNENRGGAKKWPPQIGGRGQPKERGNEPLIATTPQGYPPPLMQNVFENNIQMQMKMLENQLGPPVLPFQNIINFPGNVAPLPLLLGNQNILYPQNEPNIQGNANDLRHLLNKAKAGPEDTADLDLGGWSEDMVLIYPFLKSLLTLSDIADLKKQLSERIHALLDDPNQNLAPKFWGTGKVCKNWLMIQCADKTTFDWLLTWKPQLTARTGTKLCIRKALDAVRITHVKIVLKGIKESIRDIELRLMHQNQHLEPHMWKRGPHSFSASGTTVSFLLDAACIKLLEQSSWQVYYEMYKFKVTTVERKPIIPLVYITEV